MVTFALGVVVGLLLSLILDGEPPDGGAECLYCGWDGDDELTSDNPRVATPPSRLAPSPLGPEDLLPHDLTSAGQNGRKYGE